MRKWYKLPLIGLGCLVILAGFVEVSAAGGQAMQVASLQGIQPLLPRREAAADAVDVEGLIRLDVAVTDEAGESIHGLQQSDFALADNGRPQKIVAFRASDADSARDNSPLSVILLIDTLDLPPRLADFERQQAAAFLRQSAGHLAQPVTIYSLDDTGFFLTVSPSVDGNALAGDIASGNMADALFVASRTHFPHNVPVAGSLLSEYPARAGLWALAIIAAAQDSHPGRKLVLWLGPAVGVGTGALPDVPYIEDSNDGLSPRISDQIDAKGTFDVFSKICWYSTFLRQARIALDVLSVSGEAHSKDDEDGLKGWKSFLTGTNSLQQASWAALDKKVLAVQSGGRVLPSSKDLAQQMNQSVRDAGAYYTLTFDPPHAAHANEYHSIQVEVKKTGVNVRTNTGYYDQPFYDDPPDPAIRRITVAQLERILDTAHGGSQMARELSTVELTERLSGAKLASLSAMLHEKMAREALALVADQSAFCELPPSEILADPLPDLATKQRMLAAVANYLNAAIPRLPDFFATRVATEYSEAADPPQALHAENRSTATVLYRHGKEIIDDGRPRQVPEPHQKFQTYCTFGPNLTTLQAALSPPGSVTWGRWESNTAGRLAVFRCVALSNPSVNLVGCCFPDSNADPVIRISSGYHGEIAVDPETGAVLRSQVQYDLQGFVPTEQSDISVTYAPVVIGGETYVLPQRSVSISRGRSTKSLSEWNVSIPTWGPYETQMNVFAFDRYHAFQTSSQILPGLTPVPNTKSPRGPSTPH